METLIKIESNRFYCCDYGREKIFNTLHLNVATIIAFVAIVVIVVVFITVLYDFYVLFALLLLL